MKNRVSTGQKRRFFALFLKKPQKIAKWVLNYLAIGYIMLIQKKIKLIQGEFL